MKFSKLVNVIDVEATCWDPPYSQPKWSTSEIIEIGISVVNTETLTIEESEGILIKPQLSTVSEFCNQLTTLTQEQLDKDGIYLNKAFDILKTKYKSNNRLFVSWGDYDRKIFERNSKDFQLKYPFGPRHLNLKNLFTLMHGLNKEPGVPQALDYLKLNFEGTHHRGVDDSKNISKILISVLQQFRQ